MTSVLGEPLLLGFSSGLACLAACGPILLPWLAATGAGWAGTGVRLAGFLAGRLVGYLGFALVAGIVGLALPLGGGVGVVVVAVVDAVLGAGLIVFAARTVPGGPCVARPAGPRARWMEGLRPSALGPVALGLLTGLNLCPPFVAAAVRAAELRSLPGALAFFALFFLGTLVWFLPFLGLGALRGLRAVPVVARFTTVLVGVYYGGRGLVTLTGVFLHAWHARS